MITIKKIKNDNHLMRADPLFFKELRDIAKDRWISGKDKTIRPIGVKIIQRKILKTPFWPDTRKMLKIADFKDDTEGFLVAFNWFTVIIISFLAIIFFAGLIYTMGLITGVLHQVGVNNEANANVQGYTNLTHAADSTFGKANDAIQGLRLVALTLIFSLFVGTMIVNFLIRIHPIWFFLYVLIVVLAIILSAPVSNSYQTLLTSDIFGGILPSFTAANYIMIHLPVFIAVGGVLGGIFLFINIIKGNNEGDILK